MKLGKIFLISLQKYFPFSRKSNFKILDIFVSWCQMPKYKIRNTFYWIPLKVNTVCSWNVANLCYFIQKKKLRKNSIKAATWTLVQGSFLFLSTTSIGKWNFWSKLLKLDMYQQNDQNLSRFGTQVSSDCFLQRILWKLKGLKLVSRPHFHKIFKKKITCQVVH